MRFIFKTSYARTSRLAKHGGHVFWYGAAGAWRCSRAPWVRVRVLAGAADLRPDLRHRRARPDAAGRLHRAVLARPCRLPRRRRVHAGGAGRRGRGRSRSRWPRRRCSRPRSASSSACRRCASRASTSAIATLAFGFIVEEVFARWESVTGGNAGMHVQAAGAVRLEARLDRRRSTSSAWSSRWSATLAILNLLRSPTGRAFVAIRDSEISAQSMGIHLARYKTLSFAISAALAGIGGALYAHKLQLHLARPVRHPAVDRPAADGRDRRRSARCTAPSSARSS